MMLYESLLSAALVVVSRKHTLNNHMMNINMSPKDQRVYPVTTLNGGENVTNFQNVYRPVTIDFKRV